MKTENFSVCEGRGPEVSEWIDYVGDPYSARSIVRAFAPRRRRRCDHGEYSPWGLKLMSDRAIALFELTTRAQLPENYGFPGSGLSSRPREDVSGYMEKAARAAGWLRAVAVEPKKFRHILRLFTKGIRSDRGACSPHQRVNPYTVALGNPSPGRCNRMIAAVICRADLILKPYGLRVSWQGICRVFEDRVQRVGKAAFRAARLTAATVLTREGLPLSYRGGRTGGLWSDSRWNRRDPLVLLFGYRTFVAADIRVRGWAVSRIAAEEFSTIREAMAASGRLVEDNTDGVRALVDPTLRRDVHGISVDHGFIAGIGQDEGRSAPTTVVRGGSRSFHTRAHGREAIRQALQAWRFQDAAEKAVRWTARHEGEIGLVLIGEHPKIGVMLLRRHSYAVGNCIPGTEAWIEASGLAGRSFVPVHVAFARAWGNARAERACREAAREGLSSLE